MAVSNDDREVEFHDVRDAASALLDAIQGRGGDFGQVLRTDRPRIGRPPCGLLQAGGHGLSVGGQRVRRHRVGGQDMLATVLLLTFQLIPDPQLTDGKNIERLE
jgi:hypothetical protein